MKIWAYLALAALLIGAVSGYTAWVYRMGQQDERAIHDREVRLATTAVLTKAGTDNIKDAALGVATTEAVDAKRTASDKRLERIAVAVLTPPIATGGSDATACFDVFGDPFWELYDGTSSGPAATPATSSAGRVPGSG